MNKKIIIIPLIVLITVTIFYELPNNKGTYIVFAQPCDANCPDAFGNQIANLTVAVWLAGAWHINGTYSWLNYSCPTGFDITITAAVTVLFNVTVWLNQNNATDCPDAISKTRVYGTIETGSWGGAPVAGWNSRLLDDAITCGVFNATYYAVNHMESWIGGATAGVVYYVTLDYQAWY